MNQALQLLQKEKEAKQQKLREKKNDLKNYQNEYIRLKDQVNYKGQKKGQLLEEKQDLEEQIKDYEQIVREISNKMMVEDQQSVKKLYRKQIELI